MAKKRKTAKAKKAPKANKERNKIRRGFAVVSEFNRTRSLLWQQHKSDFASYREFLKSSLVKAVYQHCKANDGCEDEQLLEVYQQFKNPEELEAPNLDRELINSPQPYFNIIDSFWDNLPDYLWIISPDIIHSTSSYSEFLGVSFWGSGDLPYYQQTFKEWVDWCNKFRSELWDNNSQRWSGSEEAPMFRFSEPFRDESNNGRWTTAIIPCNSSGEHYDYGFFPTGDFETDGTFVPQPPTTGIEQPEQPAQTDKPEQPQQAASQEDERKKKIENDSSEYDLLNKKILNLEKDRKDIYENIKIAKELELSEEIESLKSELKIVGEKLKELRKKI
jgi:hypothetical protein